IRVGMRWKRRSPTKSGVDGGRGGRTLLAFLVGGSDSHLLRLDGPSGRRPASERSSVVSERGLNELVRVIVAEAQWLLTGRGAPIVIALDGGSGAGKSTLAAMVAKRLGAALIQTDDFFAADVTNAEWEAWPPGTRAGRAIDWRRLRTEAVEPLRAGSRAWWRAFDFISGPRPDGTYALRPDHVEREP